MWSRRRFWRGSELDGALRGRRMEASDDLVAGVARRVRAERREPGFAWSRLAFASGLSVFILGTFASLGGLSYAASGASQTYDAVKQIVVKQKLTVTVHKSAAADQYPSAPHKVKAAVVTKKNPAAKRGVAGVAVVKAKTLPFTGFSLLGTFVISLVLVGAGIVLRRRERRRS